MTAMATAPTTAAADPRDLLLQGRAWPFEEARKLVSRLGGKPPGKGYVLFETGYGPSGLPHIGTFGEVVRTTMVRHAFERMTGIKTRLFAFSDDLDGLRKVPDNVPSKEMMARYVGDKVRSFGTPLTSVPDPFSNEYPSFGHHNNARLRAFLDAFGFQYEFMSSTDCYTSGQFDAILLRVLENHDAIMNVVLPTMGPDRQRTYCPFLPIRLRDGRKQVLEIPALEFRPKDGTIVFADEVEGRFEAPVTGGACKLGWKVDWAARWVALGVDYEMAGKDLIDSVKLSTKIARILGGRAPEGFNYELFLDEKGEKISKSKGNGLTIEEWLEHGPQESLAYFMFQSPRSAKRLHFDVIPRQIDDYLSALERFAKQSPREQLDNPVWHIHSGAPPPAEDGLPFNILLNLVGVANTADRAVLWGFISRYLPGATPATHPFLDKLVGCAIAYWQRFIRPTRRHRAPNDMERAALLDLVGELRRLPANADAEAIQFQVYEVGKRHPFADLRAWFQSCYEILFGTEQGPRLGSFIAIYGVAETIALIGRALEGNLAGEAAA
jgi:lysyl-tRNA synthetase class 1